MKLSQIVITRVEEPVDEPRGEVFKIALFDGKECVEIHYCNDSAITIEHIMSYLEDLQSV